MLRLLRWRVNVTKPCNGTDTNLDSATSMPRKVLFPGAAAERRVTHLRTGRRRRRARLTTWALRMAGAGP